MRRQENEGFTVWLTGLSGTGKSTIAQLLASRLRKRGRLVEVLDGDELRSQFCKDLGFSRADREVQTERLGFLCELLNRNRIIAIVAAISPFRSARDRVRGRIHNFLEVFLDSPLEVLAQRDPKGLYDKAQRGEILDFTGISDPYEPPVSPELAVRTDLCDPTESLRSIWHLLESRKLI